jgi:hypothetical protein
MPDALIRSTVPAEVRRPLFRSLSCSAQIEIKKLLASQGECSVSSMKFCSQVSHGGWLFNGNDARNDGHRSRARAAFQGFCPSSDDCHKFSYQLWRRYRTRQWLFVHCVRHVLGDNCIASGILGRHSRSFWGCEGARSQRPSRHRDGTVG